MDFKFEHSILEQDMERLSLEVAEHKKISPEKADQEAVKSVLEKRIYGEKPALKTQIVGDNDNLLPGYLKTESAEIKLAVEELIDLVFHKGLDAAIKEARQKEPLVLDGFHDSLTAKLYGELKSRGKI
ncbi:MAG: hypothetical protein A3I89_03220 [Candidatus Harrisonbacteria bacterium RIFCSPLOWO2_02_FULL_41_11]|uniref:Uncharacterized protein n=1 Tax=Candidatus Harrisonbacteria bacterium RIFCSPHIGHO2_02_FULL_42_16 TaxID=1798404 RepID=A0A1G1ZKQ4_9BACT|nr:MAG: hypothetical protein A3B92_02710 [Candidatus Harrisonbacteria bacterium RIFCSPHIGHO2_02_FULL_42_16]OGY66249.1 MAG: hypothetical protein A3I89_03220 [Candidatus Harrisonbacteria bacterium RIFCSPLOWO2_02_FULL_41_11]